MSSIIRTGEMVKVDTDDWCNIMATLKSGTSCTIELTRCATTVSTIMEFEVYGDKGKLVYRMDNSGQKIEFVDAETKVAEFLTPPAEFNAVQSQSFINLVNGIEADYTHVFHQCPSLHKGACGF